MIAADLDVGGNLGGGAAPEQDVLTGGLDEVVIDLEGGDGFIASATADARGVRAFSSARDAIQSADIGVDHGNHVRAFDHSNPVAHFSPFSGVDPVAIEDDVVPVFGGHHPANVRVGRGSPLNSDEADVISDGGP